MSGLDSLSSWATKLQGGKLRIYLRVIVLSMVGLFILFVRIPSTDIFQEVHLNLDGLNKLRAFSLFVMTVSALATTRVRRDLYAVIALGIVGLSVAVWMTLEPAPDVALVQVVVDIFVTVVLILSL